MGLYGHNIAFIIGNGESRKTIDLNYLREKGVIYGCNALYRDFWPDILISLDRDMTNEIINSNYPGCHYHRKLKLMTINDDKNDIINQDGKFIIKSRGWSSGATAAWIASTQTEFKDIYLIGFDVYKTFLVNNMYKDTSNYVSSIDKPICTDNFKEQLRKVIKNALYKKFHWVNTHKELPWSELNNVDRISVDDFKKQFNC